ncbi:MAG: hypothetical protein PHN69_05685 [Candidatus Pacebacteria bacterium]|nr:hypothetical protein [Candidatus Paceibacterota bacterium]
MLKIHDFNSSNSKGNLGELRFLKTHPEWTKIGDGYTVADFKCGDTTLELKTDFYSMDKTPNFFMEYISNGNTGTIGGPFRDTSINYFVYYYYNDNMAYWFNTKELVDKIKSIYHKSDLVPVKNPYFTSYGFKVNRNVLSDILLKTEKLMTN